MAVGVRVDHRTGHPGVQGRVGHGAHQVPGARIQTGHAPTDVGVGIQRVEHDVPQLRVSRHHGPAYKFVGVGQLGGQRGVEVGINRGSGPACIHGRVAKLQQVANRIRMRSAVHHVQPATRVHHAVRHGDIESRFGHHVGPGYKSLGVTEGRQIAGEISHACQPFFRGHRLGILCCICSGLLTCKGRDLGGAHGGIRRRSGQGQYNGDKLEFHEVPFRKIWVEISVGSKKRIGI